MTILGSRDMANAHLVLGGSGLDSHHFRTVTVTLVLRKPGRNNTVDRVLLGGQNGGLKDSLHNTFFGLLGCRGIRYD